MFHFIVNFRGNGQLGFEYRHNVLIEISMFLPSVFYGIVHISKLCWTVFILEFTRSGVLVLTTRMRYCAMIKESYIAVRVHGRNLIRLASSVLDVPLSEPKVLVKNTSMD